MPASEEQGLIASSDEEAANTQSPMRRGLSRSLTQNLAPLLEKAAASSHTKYDPELWLPTMRASFATLGPFILYPFSILTALTFVLTLYSKAFDAPPWWLALPPFAHTVIGGALSFLMVFRTNTAYSRWWEARLQWGTITVTCRSIGTQTASMMQGGEGAKLLGLCVAFPILVKNTLRGEPTDSAELAAARSIGQLQPAEVGVLVSAQSPPMAAVEAMAVTIRQGLSNNGPGGGALASSAYLHLSTDLRSLTGAATACERIKTSPMPLGYVSALRFFLVLWLFSLPLTLVGPYGLAAAPAVSGIAFLFLNLENVAMEIEQPFGHDANDLPLEEYCAGIERVLLGLDGAAKGAAAAAAGGGSAA